MARKIFGITPRARSRKRSETKLPSPENTSMPVISTEADTVGLLSASTKWAIMPTSTMM